MKLLFNATRILKPTITETDLAKKKGHINTLENNPAFQTEMTVAGLIEHLKKTFLIG